MERKRRFQTRAQYTEEKAKSSKFYKMDKMLNYLIAVVAILIVVTLGWLISRDGEPSDQAEQQQQVDKPSDEEVAQGDDGKEQSTKPIDEQDKDDEEQAVDSEQGDEPTDTVVTPSTDPNVKEVHTNASWLAYPTEQTGEHVSTFEKGHIDYEEKLKAIFSVLDIEQQNSIVWRVGNNGNAQSAIATVHSKDKEKIYRVSIEWVDNEGWKPIQYEVLNSLQ
ncbi:YrrS family protein [Solibacillus sp. FSL K6-1523]|uniref:YrrS family protein n=1 Tax=Solibacillus sp. FSL K6-1523 TaxID=2921471 RepID=UPI0030FA81EA